MLEAAAVRSGITDLMTRRLRGRTLVLAYHNVVESIEPNGDSSLHIPLSRFREHLDVVERCADVLPVAALNGDHQVRQRPRIALTFDDAYRGAVRLGLAELRRRRMPAAMFVSPAFIPGATFWWDDLARAGGLTDALRRDALNRGRGRDTEIRRLWVPQVTPKSAPADERCCSLEELRVGAASGLVSLGSHTWSHPNLRKASPDELVEELARPLAWLRQHFGDSWIPAISYPYGLETPAVCSAAKSAGYALGFRVSGGWIPEQIEDPLRLPRLNVPAGLSANGLALRLAGLLAV